MRLNIEQILDRFTQRSRVMVLLILVIAISGTWVFSSYLKSDNYSCGEIIKENFSLHQDFAEMSRLARELQRLKMKEEMERSAAERYIERSNQQYSILPDSGEVPPAPSPVISEENEILERMLSLTEPQ